MEKQPALTDFSHEELLHELRRRENAYAQRGNLPAPHQLKVAGLTLVPESFEALAKFSSEEIVPVLREMQKVIYGTDDRVEAGDAPVQDRADTESVVALFKESDVVDYGNGTSALRTRLFGTEYSLCPSEPFSQQPCGAFCSGFLVAPDIIATAGHCTNDPNLKVEDICFVFGFRLDEHGQTPAAFPNSEIYRGRELIDFRYTEGATDWALVRLDRPVPNHPIARIRRAGRVSLQQSLHVVGHPCGLPAKYADKAEVRTNNDPAFFLANLDTYGGNSGSPVFNHDDNVVEGILVRGDNDFVLKGRCRVSNVCPAAGCSGESVTRTTEFAHLIPLA